MNSRLAVSVLFILFAVTAFRTEAIDAFKKLKNLQHSWADKVPGHCAGEILSRINSRVSGLKSELHGRKDMVTLIRVHGDLPMLAPRCAPENQPCRVVSLSPEVKTITSGFLDHANVPSSLARHVQRRVMNLIDSGRHTAAFDQVTTAVRQIHEVLDELPAK